MAHKTPAGRKWLDDRRVFTGILFILQSGLPWELLPKEMGCGTGMTCWRWARDWQRAGLWDHLHRVLLAKLRNADRFAFSRVIADSSSVRAVHVGEKQVLIRLIGARRAANIISSRCRRYAVELDSHGRKSSRLDPAHAIAG